MSTNQVTVNFYQNTNYEGEAIDFAGPLGVCSGLMNMIHSIKTGAKGWLVVYSNEDYSGNWLKIGPSSAISDLCDIDKDWRNEIQSFALYGSKPSFWDTSGGGPELKPHGCQVTFFEHDNFDGSNSSYLAPTSVSDITYVAYPSRQGGGVGASISSIITGPQAWVVLYDKANFTGNYHRQNPNTQHKDLSTVSRGSDGDWEGHVVGFQLFDSLPADWVLGFDVNKFKSLFPGSYDDGGGIRYKTQGADFRINLPTFTFPDVNTMKVYITIDHIIGISSDDHVKLEILYNADASVKGITYSFSAGSVYQIPDTFINAVDAAAKYAGAIGAFATMGISETTANAFIKVFDISCEVFNDAAVLINKLTETDGGRFYLLAVSAHVINRATCSITVSSN